MTDLRLTLACNDYDRSRPLIDGRVKPDGIDLDITILKPRELFPRMLDMQEFHSSELSLGSYASLVARDIAAHPLYDTDALMVVLPSLIDHVEDSGRAFREDFWAYGVEANHPS